MFYQKGLHIGRGHEKEMFDFLKNHYRYYTMSSWNGLKSIANKVKIYDLKLPYDTSDILATLQSVDYEPINQAIERWEEIHRGYSVGFNGRSGGYLVLYEKSSVHDACEEVTRFNSYRQALSYYGQRDLNYILKPLVQVVRDFDKLCDELRVITAFMTSEYLKNGGFDVDDCPVPFEIEYREIPRKFRKMIEKS